MEFGMSRRIKPKDKYVHISMKEIWRNLDGPPKNRIVELHSEFLNLVGRKVANGLSTCFIYKLEPSITDLSVSVLFNDTFNTFSYGYMASHI